MQGINISWGLAYLIFHNDIDTRTWEGVYIDDGVSVRVALHNDVDTEEIYTEALPHCRTGLAGNCRRHVASEP